MTTLVESSGDRPTAFRAVRLGALVVLLSTAMGCGRVIQPSAPAASSAPSVEPVTAFPTVVAPTEVPASPTGSPAAVSPDAGLVLHLTTASDLGAHGPGTTILDDRRIIWGDNRSRPIESRLGREAFADVLATIDAIDALDRDGRYSPELRPGKQPPGHGSEFHVFDLVRDDERIVVSAADPASFEGEEDIWVIPPEMHELTELAHRLVDPLAWLGPAAFTEAIRPYQATTFLVVIHLYPGGGGSVPDVDGVRWPFGEPIERVGVPYEAGGDPESRCLFIDAATASLTVLAEEKAGVQRALTDWSSPIDYEWPRIGGFVTVTLTHVLPYESGTCVELATTMR
jgi:hypothetical protein